jgi:signal transduction histidine kinase
MEQTGAAEKIIHENFIRMKFLSWVFVGFAVFALILDFSNVGVWDDEIVKYYRILDVILGVVSLFAVVVFWGLKVRSLEAQDAIVKSLICFVLVWSAVITGLAVTSLGFSTYILVLVSAAFFLYLTTATAVLFYSLSALSLVITVSLMGELEPRNALEFMATLLPILVISILLSRKNFNNRIRSIEQNNELKRLNYELSLAKEELEEKVICRTRELSEVNTQLTQTNEALMLAKKKAEESDQLKTVFLNNMSHEIRTPMNGILGFAELLGIPDLTDEKRNSYLKVIRNSSQQLLKTIDDILEISSLQVAPGSVNNESFCFNELLMDLHAIFSLKHHNDQIRFFIGQLLPKGVDSYIISDQVKLHKIISNLLENAFKFTFAGEIELGCRKQDGQLVIYVRDTGVGITAGNQNAVFQRFFQEEKELSRNSGGLGIGLSIVQENSRLLGGTISLESEKGTGTTFTLTIPDSRP